MEESFLRFQVEFFLFQGINLLFQFRNQNFAILKLENIDEEESQEALNYSAEHWLMEVKTSIQILAIFN